MSTGVVVDEDVCVSPGVEFGGRLRDCKGYAERVDGLARRRECASTKVLMTMAFGDPVRILRSPSGNVGGSLVSWVAGPHEGASLLGIDGRQQGMLLKLDALDAYSVLGVPMRLVANQFVDLAALWGRPGVRLVERLAEARSWQQRFDILGAALSHFAATGPVPDPVVAAAWRRLRATSGDVRITELAAQLGVSRRHLVRRFHDHIGLTPKTAARVLRFERALVLLRCGDHSFADVAALAGYADQAHFCREVRALGRCAPGELVPS